MRNPFRSVPRRFRAVGSPASYIAAALMVYGSATSRSAAQNIPRQAFQTATELLADRQTGVAGNANTQPTQTFRVSVRRVVLDVTVVDAKGTPVAGLTQRDFRVTDDGTLQSLRSFGIHTAEGQPPPPAPALPLNTFSNWSYGTAGGPVTVVLYDLLNTPLAAQPYAHAQLLQFLKYHSGAGQTAIFVLGDELHMLQGFTDDDNRLIAALNAQKTLSKSALLQSDSDANALSQQMSRTTGNAIAAANDNRVQGMTQLLQHMDSMQSSYLLDQRVELTAKALEGIARLLIGMPGRKNLIWLSGSFPAGVIPDPDVNGRDPATGRDAFDVMRNYSPEVMEAADLLNQSHVAVYPVDARGLQANSMFSAASSRTFEPGSGKDLKANRNFSQRLFAEHATMDEIAEQTGGHAFYNTNGLEQAVQIAVEQGSTYYTLSYSPTDTNPNHNLHRIHVELAHPGYHLAYRQSYVLQGSGPGGVSSTNAPDPIQLALQHGAPAARELFFEAHISPVGPPVTATPEQIAELARYQTGTKPGKRNKAEGMQEPALLQPYLIQFVLIPRQIETQTGPDKVRHDDLMFGMLCFDADGIPVNGTQTRLQDVIQPERWEEMQAGGYHVPLAFLVPLEARYLRLAVRDGAEGHVGSLEVGLPIPPDSPTPGTADRKP